MMKLSAQGDSLWTKYYLPSTSNNPAEFNATFGITPSSDGGIIAVGTATFDNSEDVWLVKMQADGTTGLSVSLLPPFELNLSPNPATDYLQVAVSGLAEGEAELTIFNLNGQRIRSAILTTTGALLNHSIQIDNLALGGYILHLRQGKKAMAVKWVKGK